MNDESADDNSEQDEPWFDERIISRPVYDCSPSRLPRPGPCSVNISQITSSPQHLELGRTVINALFLAIWKLRVLFGEAIRFIWGIDCDFETTCSFDADWQETPRSFKIPERHSYGNRSGVINQRSRLPGGLATNVPDPLSLCLTLTTIKLAFCFRSVQPFRISLKIISNGRPEKMIVKKELVVSELPKGENKRRYQRRDRTKRVILADC
jgi:hypothetical protein